MYLKKVDSKHLLTKWYASNSRLLERKECLFWALAFSPACFRSFTFRTRSISSRHHIPPHLIFCDPSNLPVTTDYWRTNSLQIFCLNTFLQLFNYILGLLIRLVTYGASRADLFVFASSTVHNTVIGVFHDRFLLSIFLLKSEYAKTASGAIIYT